MSLNHTRTGDILGWIVLRRADGRWALDFDGEVHEGRDVAEQAVSLALESGHQAVLGEVRWVRPGGGA